MKQMFLNCRISKGVEHEHEKTWKMFDIYETEVSELLDFEG